MHRDRLKGMFVGVFLGDALGAPHERREDRDNVYTGKLEHTSSRFNRFTGVTTVTPVGAITDDSEMTLALLNSIIAWKDYYDDSAIQSYLDWAASGCDSMGKNTRAMLKSSKKGVALGKRGYKSRHDKCLETPENERSKGNGTLMRATPLVLSKNYLKASIDDARMTNPTRVNEECNIIYVSTLIDILLGKSTELVQEYFCRDVWNIYSNRRERDVSGADKGYVLYGLHFALMAANYDLRTPEPYSTLMGEIIRKGGDTDTNAAIAGGVLGARLGFEAMMKEDITRSNFETMMNSEWNESRPREYTVVELDRLVDAATAIFMKNREP